jgi:tetratricopeptide (TPR) repeat protein
MFNLARTYLHNDEHQKSEELLTHVLAKREHFFGSDHPDTLMVRNELGMTLCAQKKRLAEAEHLVRSTLQARKRILGEEHAYTLWSVNDLSKVCIELGRLDEAVAILEEIIPTVKRTLGDEHVGMFMTKANLSRAYIRSDKWEQAASLIKWLRTVVPPDHPDWVHAEWGYAYYVLHNENDAETAEQCCKNILSKVSEKRFLSLDNSRVIATAEILLRIYEEQERDEDVKELERRFPTVGNNRARTSIDNMPLPKWRSKRHA